MHPSKGLTWASLLTPHRNTMTWCYYSFILQLKLRLRWSGSCWSCQGKVCFFVGCGCSNNDDDLGLYWRLNSGIQSLPLNPWPQQGKVMNPGNSTVLKGNLKLHLSFSALICRVHSPVFLLSLWLGWLISCSVELLHSEQIKYCFYCFWVYLWEWFWIRWAFESA
jgi:hypothetical protein